MKAPCEDIATLLSGQSSLGLTLAEDLFFSQIPDKPEECVAVLDNPGERPMLTLSKTTSNYFYSSVTVYVRTTEYEEGWEQIHEILSFLHGEWGTVIDTTYYALIKAISDPQLLHKDENDRFTFIVNFEVQRRNNLT